HSGRGDGDPPRGFRRRIPESRAEQARPSADRSALRGDRRFAENRARAASGKEELPRRFVRALSGRSRSPHPPRCAARRGASRGGLSGYDPRTGQSCDRTRSAAPGRGNADGDSGRAAPAHRLSAERGRARRACSPARRHRGREQGAMRMAPLRDRGGDARSGMKMNRGARLGSAMSSADKANPYELDLDKNPANYAPLTPLGFIERAATVYPAHLAVIHGARRATWAETYARCRRLASRLARRGIGVGDTVAAMLANTPEMLECHFGVPMAGAVINS